MVPNSTENNLKIIGLVVGILLLADLLFLNFKFFSSAKTASIPIVLPTPSPEVREDCPAACLDLIPAAASSGAETVSGPMVQPTTIVRAVAKEIYIPLGTGASKSLDWTAIPGAEVVLDTANFSKIKSTIFEAFLQIPTGNGKVYAKLYNVSDKHDVWSSEVAVEGGGVQRMESKNIILDPGRKVYRVMMKTTMGYEALLESARLKIILE